VFHLLTLFFGGIRRISRFDWKGSIRFTDAQGNPVKGIKVTLDPEEKDLQRSDE
jgi:hypothetical protein